MSASTASAGATAVQNQPQGPQPSGRNTLLPQGSESKDTPAGSPPNAPGPNTPGLAPKGAMEHPKTKVTVLPPAGREEQLERWGVHPDRIGGQDDRRGHGPDDAIHTAEDVDDDERGLEERGFLMDGGWRLVQAAKGTVRHVDDGGMTSHRGVLHPSEHVDPNALRALVEDELGFTYDQVRSVYRQGPLSAEQRELRNRIDARVLTIARAGGNLTELGKALGFPIHEGSTPWVIKKAVARAKEAQ